MKWRENNKEHLGQKVPPLFEKGGKLDKKLTLKKKKTGGGNTLVDWGKTTNHGKNTHRIYMDGPN